MENTKREDFFDETDEGHWDTRHDTFECDTPNENLGFDPGIDIQG